MACSTYLWLLNIHFWSESSKNSHFFSFLSDRKFDVVFLQEVWFKKDYAFLKKCTKATYKITKYDKECGKLNKVKVVSLFLGCAQPHKPVVTLSSLQKLEQSLFWLALTTLIVKQSSGSCWAVIRRSSSNQKLVVGICQWSRCCQAFVSQSIINLSFLEQPLKMRVFPVLLILIM